MFPTATLLGAKQRILTSKMGNKNFYKGTRGGKLGRHTPTSFIIEPHRLRRFVVPDLTDFNLFPYVSKEVPNDVKRSHSFRDYFRDQNLTIDRELGVKCRASAKRAYLQMIEPRKPQLLYTRKNL